MKSHISCLAVSIITWSLLSCGRPENDREKMTSSSQQTDIPDSKLSKEEARRLLTNLVGKWTVIESSFSNDANSLGKMEVISVADGSGVYSKMMTGSGDRYYESVALWGYSESNDQVRVFEVNNIGTADTHVGYFATDSTLQLRFQDPKTDIIQERAMRWRDDTLRMSAVFIDKETRTEHKLVMVRK